MDRLFLADLAGSTEHEVKQHIAGNYAGKESGFSYGNPTEQDIKDLATTLEGYDVIVAYESVGSYGCDSSSWFLLRKKDDGTLWETSGSHCSCYGFEGQFDLSEAPLEYLQSENFYMGTGGYDDDSEKNVSAVKAFLAALKS